jgi:hypothetical protein
MTPEFIVLVPWMVRTGNEDVSIKNLCYLFEVFMPTDRARK